MERYLRGIVNAFGHRCKECRFYKDHHCGHPDWKGSNSSEVVYGDKKHMEPEAHACMMFDGLDEFDIELEENENGSTER